MSTRPTPSPDPDGIARKVFLLTMLGSIAFLSIVAWVTLFVPGDAQPSGEDLNLTDLVVER